MTELGKLLTFMYDEDRLQALEMYDKMFDNAVDEQALLQLLVSPTKQAVIVARAYNAREHKLQVQAQSRKDSAVAEDGGDEYIAAIDTVRQAAVAQGLIAPEVTAGQFSLFEDDGQEAEPAASEKSAPAHLAPEAPAQEETEPPEREAPAQPAEEEPETPREEPPQDAPQPDSDGTVDKFMEDFSIQNDELAPKDGPAPAAPAPAEIEEIPDGKGIVLPGETVRKPRIFLLILYIIAAVPLTLIGLVLLLVPTAVFLALAVVVLFLGGGLLAAAFSGFAVLANTLVLLGAALITLALGLLLMWTFVWFIGGAMAGLVRSVLELGGNWCYKEVPAV